MDFKKSYKFFKNNLINFHSSSYLLIGGATFLADIKGDRVHSNTAH